ncbi:hypothetical protein [Streptomyces sp. NPDC048650]|uniref:hypothetical protein n=1 Tax=unclassified Streptomyces TaxID=2593676 RepID=UPI00371D575B
MDIMRRLKQESAAPTVDAQEGDSLGFSGDDGRYDTVETFDIYRVTCPDCGQPIALLADEDTLPEHALCPTPWNPFGLTVCQGSGRAATEAPDADDTMDAQERDVAVLLTLPESLDWRRQPFSHIAGAGTSSRVPQMRPGA